MWNLFKVNKNTRNNDVNHVALVSLVSTLPWFLCSTLLYVSWLWKSFMIYITKKKPLVVEVPNFLQLMKDILDCVRVGFSDNFNLDVFLMKSPMNSIKWKYWEKFEHRFLAPSRWNWTTTTLIVYEFEARTPDHRRSTRHYL